MKIYAKSLILFGAVVLNVVSIFVQAQNASTNNKLCIWDVKNLTAILFENPGENYTLYSITNPKVDFDNNYKVEIEPINTIPKLCKNSFVNLKRLQVLSLIYNGIEEIEAGAFKSLPRFEELHLSYNKLEVLPTGVFNNLTLVELYLTGNRIYNIEARAFDDMPNLQVLDLSFNLIQVLDSDWFKNTPKLAALNFVFNYIRNIQPDAFKNLNSKNEISMWFMNNTIKSIGKEAFRNLTKMGTLWLNNNAIKSLPDEMFLGNRIDVLGLENNQLQCLSGKFLSEESVGELYAAGNAFSCACLRQIEEWGVRAKVKTFHDVQVLEKCGLKARFVVTTTPKPAGLEVDL